MTGGAVALEVAGSELRRTGRRVAEEIVPVRVATAAAARPANGSSVARPTWAELGCEVECVETLSEFAGATASGELLEWLPQAPPALVHREHAPVQLSRSSSSSVFLGLVSSLFVGRLCHGQFQSLTVFQS